MATVLPGALTMTNVAHHHPADTARATITVAARLAQGEMTTMNALGTAAHLGVSGAQHQWMMATDILPGEAATVMTTELRLHVRDMVNRTEMGMRGGYDDRGRYW